MRDRETIDSEVPLLAAVRPKQDGVSPAAGAAAC
jgi:hypothetical protein